MARTILITGPTSGTGYYLANRLAPGNALILVGRNPDKLAALESSLKEKAQSITIMPCDLSDFESVNALHNQLEDDPPAVDVFISNAGILGNERPVINASGFEATFMTNYLSHYVLQAALVGVIRERNGIIFNMSSASHDWYSIDFDDLQSTSHYLPMKAYARSKRMLLLLGKWMADQGVTAYNIDPGTFKSGIARSRGHWFRMLYSIGALGMRPPEKAAADIVGILESNLPAFPAGALIRRGKVKDFNPDEAEIGKLIDQTATMCGIDFRKRAGINS